VVHSCRGTPAGALAGAHAIRNKPGRRIGHPTPDAQLVERDFRRPAAAEREAPARRAARERHHGARTADAEHEPGAPSGRAQHGDRDCVIIAAHGLAGNVEPAAHAAKSKLGKVFEQAVPRAALERRRVAHAEHVVAQARAEASLEQRQQHGPHPAAQMSGVAIGGVVVRGEPALRRVRRDLRLRERQQRPDQPAARPRRHGRQASGCAAP